MRTTVAATLLLAFTTLCGPVFAQASKDVAAVQAGTFAVDGDHTQVFWNVSHFGFATYQGRFDKVSGSLTLDPKAPANDKLDVTIPVDSVSTPSAKLNDELVSADWFDAKQFPTITFKSTKVVPNGATAAKVTGDLTIHGVTKAVTLDVQFLAAGPNPVFKVYTVGFAASGDIKRTDFGVTKYAPYIGDETHITLNGTFLKP